MGRTPDFAQAGHEFSATVGHSLDRIAQERRCKAEVMHAQVSRGGDGSGGDASNSGDGRGAYAGQLRALIYAKRSGRATYLASCTARYIALSRVRYMSTANVGRARPSTVRAHLQSHVVSSAARQADFQKFLDTGNTKGGLFLDIVAEVKCCALPRWHKVAKCDGQDDYDPMAANRRSVKYSSAAADASDPAQRVLKASTMAGRVCTQLQLRAARVITEASRRTLHARERRGGGRAGARFVGRAVVRGRLVKFQPQGILIMMWAQMGQG